MKDASRMRERVSSSPLATMETTRKMTRRPWLADTARRVKRTRLSTEQEGTYVMADVGAVSYSQSRATLSFNLYFRYSWFFLPSAMSFVNSGLMVSSTSVVARPSASNAGFAACFGALGFALGLSFSLTVKRASSEESEDREGSEEIEDSEEDEEEGKESAGEDERLGDVGGEASSSAGLGLGFANPKSVV